MNSDTLLHAFTIVAITIVVALVVYEGIKDKQVQLLRLKRFKSKDGRPHDADVAILRALRIDDHFDRIEYLQAWSEGRWSDCQEILDSQQEGYERVRT